jgi:drug/metabolite transporter (DMT)-like permease
MMVFRSDLVKATTSRTISCWVQYYISEEAPVLWAKFNFFCVPGLLLLDFLRTRIAWPRPQFPLVHPCAVIAGRVAGCLILLT